MPTIFFPLISFWNTQFRRFNSKPNLGELKSRKRVVGRQLVLFIHGLSGSALGTWEPMLKAFEDDDSLKDYAFDCYSYPTTLHRVPFGKRMAGIKEIANGLRTYVETHHNDKTRMVLVGHSLGGVIARQYILDEIKSQRTNNFSGVVLFATPHTGASLANLGSLLSSSHHHLRQICKGSDILEIINDDWVKLKVEQHIEALYIVGGCDAIVAKESAAPYLGADNIRTLIEHDHTGVIKPTDRNDTRFMILRDFILRTMPPIEEGGNMAANTQSANDGDVLFDIYTRDSEKFYIERSVDKTLFDATRSSHAWVCGTPGVGKTAALKRLAENSGWCLQHVILDGNQGLSALSLMREVCIILFERAGIEPGNIRRDIDQPALLASFRRVLSELCKTELLAILVEEIPLSSGEAYTEFLDIANHLVLSTETISAASRVVWLFSSIRDPRPDVRPGSAKFCERVQFFEFAPWEDHYIEKLLDLIGKELNMEQPDSDRRIIISNAKGSPRFIKMLFRRKRNEMGAQKSLNELLSSVELDLA